MELEARMKEHSIIFSAPMVRAIIEGRKTQTRRIIKNPEWYGCTTGDCPHSTQAACDEAMVFFAPYPVGTRIWVKETWRPAHAAFYPHFPIVYRADGEMDIEHGEVYSPEAKRTYPFRWRPSIHM